MSEKLLSTTQLKLIAELMEEMAEKCKLVGAENEKVKIAELIEKEFGIKVYEPGLLDKNKPAVLLNENCKAYLYMP